MDLWGQLDDKHEGDRVEYGTAIDTGQEETIQIEIFPNIGISQGMGEQKKKVLNKRMDKEVGNQTYVFLNEGALIFVFSNNFFAGLQGYCVGDDVAYHGHIMMLVGVWNTCINPRCLIVGTGGQRTKETFKLQDLLNK